MPADALVSAAFQYGFPAAAFFVIFKIYQANDERYAASLAEKEEIARKEQQAVTAALRENTLALQELRAGLREVADVADLLQQVSELRQELRMLGSIDDSRT